MDKKIIIAVTAVVIVAAAFSVWWFVLKDDGEKIVEVDAGEIILGVNDFNNDYTITNTTVFVPDLKAKSSAERIYDADDSDNPDVGIIIHVYNTVEEAEKAFLTRVASLPLELTVYNKFDNCYKTLSNPYYYFQILNVRCEVSIVGGISGQESLGDFVLTILYDNINSKAV